MTNSPQRSAMWPPSTTQSVVVERPSPGTQKPSSGAMVSMPTATAHSVSRAGPSAKAPAIQSSAVERLPER